jgi:hypothetical protein
VSTAEVRLRLNCYRKDSEASSKVVYRGLIWQDTSSLKCPKSCSTRVSLNEKAIKTYGNPLQNCQQTHRPCYYYTKASRHLILPRLSQINHRKSNLPICAPFLFLFPSLLLPRLFCSRATCPITAASFYSAAGAIPFPSRRRRPHPSLFAARASTNIRNAAMPSHSISYARRLKVIPSLSYASSKADKITDESKEPSSLKAFIRQERQSSSSLLYDTKGRKL